MNKRQLGCAIEIVREFMETEGLEFWITTIRGDGDIPVRRVSTDILQRLLTDSKEV